MQGPLPGVQRTHGHVCSVPQGENHPCTQWLFWRAPALDSAGSRPLAKVCWGSSPSPLFTPLGKGRGRDRRPLPCIYPRSTGNSPAALTRRVAVVEAPLVLPLLSWCPSPLHKLLEIPREEAPALPLGSLCQCCTLGKSTRTSPASTQHRQLWWREMDASGAHGANQKFPVWSSRLWKRGSILWLAVTWIWHQDTGVQGHLWVHRHRRAKLHLVHE